MKKRLRKKLRMREFKELGFCVRFQLDESMSLTDVESFLDGFLTEVIEANGLDFGGGGNHEWQGFVTLDRRGSVTEEQRKLVDEWLERHPQVRHHQVGEFLDAWYGTCEWEENETPES